MGEKTAVLLPITCSQLALLLVCHKNYLMLCRLYLAIETAKQATIGNRIPAFQL